MTVYENTKHDGFASSVSITDDERDALTAVFADDDAFEQEAIIWVLSGFGAAGVDVEGVVRFVDLPDLSRRSGLAEDAVRRVLSFVGAELGAHP